MYFSCILEVPSPLHLKNHIFFFCTLLHLQFCTFLPKKSVLSPPKMLFFLPVSPKHPFFFIYFLFFFFLLALVKCEEIWGRKKGCWQIVDACAFHIGGMEIAVQRHSPAVQQKLWLWNLRLKISGKCFPSSEFHSGHLVPDSEAVHCLSVASKLHSVQQFSVLLTNLFILGLKFGHGELFVNQVPWLPSDFLFFGNSCQHPFLHSR